MNRRVDVSGDDIAVGPAAAVRLGERGAGARTGVDHSRRRLLRMAGATGVAVAASALAGTAGCRPLVALSNPCRSGRLPAELSNHPLVRAAWSGLDASQLWDCHVHLFGGGDSAAGVWINPSMYRWTSPMKVLQRRFYENAACTGHDRSSVDARVVDRLVELVDGMQAAAESGGDTGSGARKVELAVAAVVRVRLSAARGDNAISGIETG